MLYSYLPFTVFKGKSVLSIAQRMAGRERGKTYFKLLCFYHFKIFMPNPIYTQINSNGKDF